MPTAEWEKDRDYIINHMNEDHVNNMVDLVHYYFNTKPKSVELVDISSEGFYIKTEDTTHYLAFDNPCSTTIGMAEESARMSIFAFEELKKAEKN
ncbi:MAG: DUF2470 domain-containing protein [Colwellia sp.]|nr:DUF2470 domain-containing protein [Colwellia sp.]